MLEPGHRAAGLRDIEQEDPAGDERRVRSFEHGAHRIKTRAIIEAIVDYSKVTVYYEVYVSLGVQEIQTIDLVSTIQAMSKEAEDSPDIITPNETIFEPSLDEIADLMERGMMSLALSQAILQSGLAQAASRFNAMAAAKKLAVELVAFRHLEFYRSKRAESDRRLREVLIGIKKKKKRRAEVKA